MSLNAVSVAALAALCLINGCTAQSSGGGGASDPFKGFTKKMEGSKYADPAGSCSCCTNDPTNDAGRLQLLSVANGVKNCTGQKFETAENDVYILAVARGKTVEQCVDICRKETYCLGAYFLKTGTDAQGSTCKSLARVQVTKIGRASCRERV